MMIIHEPLWNSICEKPLSLYLNLNCLVSAYILSQNWIPPDLIVWTRTLHLVKTYSKSLRGRRTVSSCDSPWNNTIYDLHVCFYSLLPWKNATPYNTYANGNFIQTISFIPYYFRQIPRVLGVCVCMCMCSEHETSQKPHIIWIMTCHFHQKRI